MEDRLCQICQFLSTLFYCDERTFFKCPNCALIFTNDFPQNTLEEKYETTNSKPLAPFLKQPSDGSYFLYREIWNAFE